jgi:hypothetical protein
MRGDGDLEQFFTQAVITRTIVSAGEPGLTPSALASFAGMPRANTSSWAYSMVSPNIFAICSCTGVRP